MLTRWNVWIRLKADVNLRKTIWPRYFFKVALHPRLDVYSTVASTFGIFASSSLPAFGVVGAAVRRGSLAGKRVVIVSVPTG